MAPSRSLGFMWARGNGSTLHRKNIYPVLGEPLLAHSLRAIRESGVVDQFYVFTEDAEVASVTESFGFRAVPRPLHLVDYAHPDFNAEEAWTIIADYVWKDVGPLREPRNGGWTARLHACLDFALSVNCNNVTLSPDTFRALRRKLAAESDLRKVYPAVKVEPPLYLVEGSTLWPVLHVPGTDRQVCPPVYRVLANTSLGMTARTLAGCTREALVEIPEIEALDVHTRDDIALAEAILAARRAQQRPALAKRTA